MTNSQDKLHGNTLRPILRVKYDLYAQERENDKTKRIGSYETQTQLQEL
jgi:hypothetical protein